MARRDWSLIEPAVKILSACLPTMTPFLNIRIHWEQLRSSFHNNFRSNRSSHERSQSNLRQFQHIPKSNVNGAKPEVDKGGLAKERPSTPTVGNPSPDDMHLRSIMVRHDITWTESPNKRNDSLTSS
ncbi:MAG: hypothetical protein Q9187_002616 [Circinaria calcarea]